MSDINIPSKREAMLLVFNDLRKSPPKPLAESGYLKSLRVHKRYLSMPNLSIVDFSAKAIEIGWRSTPNLKFRQVASDAQIPESLEQPVSKSQLDVRGKQCVSTPNLLVRPNSAGDTPAVEIVWWSTQNLKFEQVASDVHRPESSEQRDFKSLLDSYGRLCVSTPNIPVCQNIAGETPAVDIGWRSTPNLKFEQVASDVHRAESLEHHDSMIPERQNVDSDAPEPPQNPHRSFWRRTKKFVKRLLCCCVFIDMIDQ